MSTTEVFNNKKEFLSRADKSVNGVSPEFAEKNPDYEEGNKLNLGCWNCYNHSPSNRLEGCFNTVLNYNGTMGRAL